MLLLLLLPSRFSCVWLLCDPRDGPPAHQSPLSLGFSSQEHWSGLPFPSPIHESEKWKWSHSVVSDSSRPHGLQPTRLLRPWDFPGKSTGVGCHCLLQISKWHQPKKSQIPDCLIFAIWGLCFQVYFDQIPRINLFHKRKAIAPNECSWLEILKVSQQQQKKERLLKHKNIIPFTLSKALFSHAF